MTIQCKWLFPLLTVLCIGIARADEGVLVSSIPQGADKSQVLEVVRQAFIGRSWTIESGDDLSVTARLFHGGYDAQLKVSLEGDSLRYLGNTTGMVHERNPSLSTGNSRRSSTDTPERWLTFLRFDISKSLSGIPKHTSQESAGGAPNDIVERLKTLDGLHKAGLVTDNEYKKKKEEILGRL